ncbi:uncharacterized protein LOC144573719 [Carex rostrata]
MNPHSSMSSKHSSWPGLLCIYNLPPWLCMKRKYIMLTLLISGPKQPGNDIDVYLAPLIEDLQKLWLPGVQMFDAYSKETFTLRAMIFCTINDFPAYGNLSGYSVKGEKACPICQDDTDDMWLSNCSKTVYMGHRRFLPTNHAHRKRKKEFNGKTENNKARYPLTGKEVYSRVKDIKVDLGKFKKKGGRKKGAPKSCWKKRSIFWNLPYWEHLEVRHCLDVMHVVKNVCDSIVGTLLNIPGKSKDGINVRKDMQLMNIRPDLQPGEKERSDVREIKMCGPVFLRYMYPFERYMGILKGYVRNRYRPEGSIIRAYAAEEVIEYCTQYLDDLKTVGIPKSRHEGRLHGVGTIGSKLIIPDRTIMALAHFHVLQHLTDVHPYLDEHMTILRQHNPTKSDKWLIGEHNEKFQTWFACRVLEAPDEENIKDIVKKLALGPVHVVRSFQGFDINGYTFYTRTQDEKSTVQNSGVTLVAVSSDFSGAKGAGPSQASMSYYGFIEEIWELDYRTFKIPLFLCKWVDNRKGVKVDNDGFIVVDFNKLGYKDDPFILARQATQVFYVIDPTDRTKHVVLSGKRRIIGIDNVVDEEVYDHFDEIPPFSIGMPTLPTGDYTETSYMRHDHNEGEWIEES